MDLPMWFTFQKGVTNFSLDEYGNFQVFLDQACNAKFEDELHYDSNVSGNLTFGQIGSLSGISAKDLFLWFRVKKIWVDIPSSGLIYFDVGVVSKQFSLSSFETPRDCVASPVSKIGSLSGISAKDLFLWFRVKKIWVDIPSSGLIYFDVGVVSKQFSLSSFETPRDCVASPVSKILSRKPRRDEPNAQELLRAAL
ncbi:hypothetical protein Tco_1169528 [Tanacetum coccineum]